MEGAAAAVAHRYPGLDDMHKAFTLLRKTAAEEQTEPLSDQLKTQCIASAAMLLQSSKVPEQRTLLRSRELRQELHDFATVRALASCWVRSC